MILGIAERRPDWQLIMLGPIVKIDPATLPRRHNIHWLGSKDYRELPTYMAGWDVGLMPFAMNESTRFISPTKTPEYLAAGLPVISTPIRDVERQYGDTGMVRIKSTAEGFVSAAEKALAPEGGSDWRDRADRFLQTVSWDRTWSSMNDLIEQAAQPAAKSAKMATAPLATMPAASVPA